MRTLKALLRLLLIVALAVAALALFTIGADSYDDEEQLAAWAGAAVAAILFLVLLPAPIRRAIWLFIQWVLMLGGLLAVFVGLADMDEPSAPVIAIVGALVFVILFWRLVIFPIRLRRNRRTVPATIVRISHKVRVGDAAMMRQDMPHGPVVAGTETYVLFDSRGERIRVKLNSAQARYFAEHYSEGDTGRLTYSLGRLIAWEPPTPERPLSDARHVRVFISYSHQWTEDAEYIAQFFRSQGLSVWFDKDQLRVGSKLGPEITNAIQNTHYFVPLLSAEYWNSEWCVREFELAAAVATSPGGTVTMLPIKVSTGPIAMPPHLRQLYRNTLGEPIFLDLRGRNPIEQLKALAAQMSGPAPKPPTGTPYGATR